LRLCGIKAENLEKVWDHVVEDIRETLVYSYDKFTVQDIFNSLKNMDMQLWVIVDQNNTIHATIVTQIVDYPSKRVMLFVIISGKNFVKWSHFLGLFTRFARSHNCRSIEAYGRPGWENKTKKLGFKKIHTLYSLELTEGTTHERNI